MKLKKIRNALLVVLTLALVSATAVAVTWAYVNKSLGSKTNTFTNSEDIDVGISEPNWTDTDTYTATNGYSPGDANTVDATTKGEELADHYYPDLQIPKDPRLTNISDISNASSADEQAAVKEIVGVELTYNLKNGSTTYTYPTYADFAANVATVQNGSAASPNNGYTSTWHQFDDDTHLYYQSEVPYKYQTANIFDFVKINSVTNISDTAYASLSDVPASVNGIYTDGTNYSVKVWNNGTPTRITLSALPNFEIKIKGYAVQSKPFGLASGADISGSGDTNKAARNALRSLMGLAAE